MNYFINKNVRSDNYNNRPFNRIEFIIIHYTELSLEDSLQILTDKNSKVSSHYLIPDNKIDDKEMIYELVSPENRAWHAGVSQWKNINNINDVSIGIEIVNKGFSLNNDGKKEFIPYSDYQINLLINLCKDLIKKYNIDPKNIMGHSDIAYDRKIDPGPLFPWKKLAENGLGIWYDEDKIKSIDSKEKPFDNNKMISEFIKKLGILGYDISQVENDLDDKKDDIGKLISAFQMHFRQSDYSGILDNETSSILDLLITACFPR